MQRVLGYKGDINGTSRCIQKSFSDIGCIDINISHGGVFKPRYSADNNGETDNHNRLTRLQGIYPWLKMSIFHSDGKRWQLKPVTYIVHGIIVNSNVKQLKYLQKQNNLQATRQPLSMFSSVYTALFCIFNIMLQGVCHTVSMMPGYFFGTLGRGRFMPSHWLASSFWEP